VTPRVGVVALPAVAALAAAAAVAAAVLTYLAAWALLVFVCLLGAVTGWNVLPSPNSWTLRAVYLTAAILVGLHTFRDCRERELSRRQAWGSTPVPPPTTVPAGLAGILVVSGIMSAVGVRQEHNYLEYLPQGMSQEAGLVYGHQACDWLAAQRWGRPPGAEHIGIPAGWGGIGDVRGPRRRQVQSRTLVYQPAHVQWHWANSTQRLKVYYLEHLDAQHPGPLTQNERQQASVIGSAWFELCPFQQWVHRPIGASD
jgi:hypothetical protein